MFIVSKSYDEPDHLLTFAYEPDLIGNENDCPQVLLLKSFASIAITVPSDEVDPTSTCNPLIYEPTAEIVTIPLLGACHNES